MSSSHHTTLIPVEDQDHEMSVAGGGNAQPAVTPGVLPVNGLAQVAPSASVGNQHGVRVCFPCQWHTHKLINLQPPLALAQVNPQAALYSHGPNTPRKRAIAGSGISGSGRDSDTEAPGSVPHVRVLSMYCLSVPSVNLS